ncbi:MAG: hypothetical protein H0W85_02305 [Methylotenera sp.]|nr:hypothetical protein [Methylotenera sp.]
MMKSLGCRYMQYINYSYKRSGTLWEGRQPQDYKWSSYRANALGAKDELLTSHTEYEALSTTPEQRKAA